MKCHGDEYRVSAGVIIDVVHDLPIVGVIQEIYVVNGDIVVFQVDQFSTSYEPHYRAYVLDNDSSSRIICHSNLFIHSAIYIKKCNVSDFSTYFILPFALCTCD